MELTFGAATLSATVSLWHTPGRPGPGQERPFVRHQPTVCFRLKQSFTPKQCRHAIYPRLNVYFKEISTLYKKLKGD